MSNKPGRAWNFPNHGNQEQIEALYKARIEQLETVNKKLQDRVEQLLGELTERRIEPPEEILDAYIVTGDYDENDS